MSRITKEFTPSMLHRTKPHFFMIGIFLVLAFVRVQASGPPYNGDSGVDHSFEKFGVRPFDIQVSTQKALAGDVQSQYELGCRLEYGQSVPQDHQKAIFWLQKAADQQYAPAWTLLGVIYKNSELQRKIGGDFASLQFECFQRGASLGDVWAQGALGECYYGGIGVLMDRNRGMELMKKAALAGDEFVADTLGSLYAAGNGVTVDFNQAKRWYLLSWALGDVSAELNWKYLHQYQKEYAQDKGLVDETDPEKVYSTLVQRYLDQLGQSADGPELQRPINDWQALSSDPSLQPREKAAQILDLQDNPQERVLAIWGLLIEIDKLSKEKYASIEPKPSQEALDPQRFAFWKKKLVPLYLKLAGVDSDQPLPLARKYYRTPMDYAPLSYAQLLSIRTNDNEGDITQQFIVRGKTPEAIQFILDRYHHGISDDEKNYAFKLAVLFKIKDLEPELLNVLRQTRYEPDEGDGDGDYPVAVVATPVTYQPGFAEVWGYFAALNDVEIKSKLEAIYQKSRDAAAAMNDGIRTATSEGYVLPDEEQERLLCLAGMGSKVIGPELEEKRAPGNKTAQAEAALAGSFLDDVTLRPLLLDEIKTIQLASGNFVGKYDYAQWDQEKYVAQFDRLPFMNLARLSPDPADIVSLKTFEKIEVVDEDHCCLDILALEARISRMAEEQKIKAIRELEAKSGNEAWLVHYWALEYLKNDTSALATETLKNFFDHEEVLSADDPYIPELLARGVAISTKKVYLPYSGVSYVYWTEETVAAKN